MTLAGSWTAEADSTGNAVTGTWTLVDASGKTVARGGWSAAKAPSGWTGSWRAAAPGNAEYSGSWSATLDLRANAPFTELFARALQSAVNGTWRAGQQSGSWSIRAFN